MTKKEKRTKKIVFLNIFIIISFGKKNSISQIQEFKKKKLVIYG
tara:strand:- start:47 stop:178 length:132 start_codon:yes stop_codon:yes gene_type:complete